VATDAVPPRSFAETLAPGDVVRPAPPRKSVIERFRQARRMTVGGGLVAIVVALAWFLSTFFTGLGTGGGGGFGLTPGAGTGTSSESADGKTANRVAPPKTVAPSVSEKTRLSPGMGRDAILYVVIDGENYLIEDKFTDGTTELRPTTIEEILERVKNSTIPAGKIRIRVGRRGESVSRVETALDAAFFRAGILRDRDVYWIEDVLP